MLTTMMMSRRTILRGLGGGAALTLLPRPLAAAVSGPAASAAESTAMPVVVALFTSQGCSSCPPADALLHELAERPDVLALSLPVDYWDYLGWKDTLASPSNTRRQKTYAANMGARTVYTPQMVINGMEDVVGSRRGEVTGAIEAQQSRPPSEVVPVSLTQDGNSVQISVGANPLIGNVEATLWMVYFEDQATVEIKRGENRGRELSYTNVVRDMVPIGMWKGEPLHMEVAMESLASPGYDGCALILQTDGQGPILGAAKLDM